ncbi:hypothetical protein [Deefgea sp. CFH1-16]|uniref:hypothetical protein n=1 Tax=Deefgea sp. CFH1-16 TaxID=2675457 RepID=UPI0015F677C2|nr:hypothetical protein [Deefgea sp. CFH1-16]MBM5573289.1 hypothetical protein [Deefgea sp. CFH1-16]
MSEQSPLLLIDWTPDEAKIYQRLSRQRQCTSVELIKHCVIQNPHGLIASMNQKLADSDWQIFISVARSSRPQATPIAYYRLCRKPLMSFDPPPTASR